MLDGEVMVVDREEGRWLGSFTCDRAITADQVLRLYLDCHYNELKGSVNTQYCDKHSGCVSHNLWVCVAAQ